MSDPKIAEFYKRAARLELQRARGRGFEAPGTLGRSYYHRRQRARRSILWPVMFLLVAGFVIKGAIFFTTGPDVYNARVAELQGSKGMVDQVGGWVMQPDPVTEWLALEIGIGVKKLTS